MNIDTLKKVTNAEKNAEVLIEQAKTQSLDSIHKTKLESHKNLEVALQTAHTQGTSLCEQAQKDAKKEYEAEKQISADKISTLIEKSRSKQAQAVEHILQRIIQKWQ